MENLENKMVQFEEVKHETRSSCYKVEKSMLTAKLAYLLANMKDSCYWPFMILFLTEIGLSPTQAGLVNGVRFIGAIIGAPTWGLIADQRQAHKTLIVVLCWFAILTLCSQVAVPYTFRNTFHNTTHASIKANHEANQIKFYVLLVLNFIASFFDGSIMSFIDSAILQKIKYSATKPDFGFQRLFGAIGFGSGALLSSTLVNIFHMNSVIFCVYFASVSSLSICSWFLNKGVSYSHDEPVDSTRKLLLVHVKKGRNVFFFATVLVLGIMNGFYISFFALLMNVINAPTILIGVALMVAAVSGGTTMALSTRVLELCGSTWIALLIGLFSWSLRFLLYYFARTSWLMLIIQFSFQGFGFGLVVVTMITHIKQVSPERILTCMCSITNLLFFFAGTSVANIVGGKLCDYFGVRVVFLGLSILSFLWCIALMLFYRLRIRLTSESEADIPLN